MSLKRKLPILLILQVLMFTLFVIIDSIYHLKVVLVIQLVISVLAYRVFFGNLFNMPFLFLSTFSFFILSRIFTDLFFGINFAQTVSFSFYTYSLEIQKEMLRVLFIHIWAIFTGIFLYKLILRSEVGHSFNYSEKLFKFSVPYFWISFPVFINTVLQKLYLVFSEGYLSLFQDNRGRDNLVIVILNCIFTFSFYLILVSKPPLKRLKIFTIIYLFALILTLLTGQRGFALCQIIIISFALVSLYNLKINFKRVFLFGFLILFTAIYIGFYRSNSDFNLNSDLFVFFVHTQGVSLQVLGYSIEYQDSLNYNFINLFSEIRSVMESAYYRIIGGKSEITSSAYLSMKEFGHLGLKLSYMLNPNKFFLGQGLGTSYIAEIYLVGGKILVLLFGLIFGFSLEFINLRIKQSKKFLLFGLLFGSSILFLPRDSLLAFISTNFIFIILYFLFKIFYPKLYRELKNP